MFRKKTLALFFDAVSNLNRDFISCPKKFVVFAKSERGKFSLGATTKLVAFIFLNFVLHDPLLVQLTSMKKAGHACVGFQRRKRQIEQLLLKD